MDFLTGNRCLVPSFEVPFFVIFNKNKLLKSNFRKRSPQLVYETIGHIISKTDSFLVSSSYDRPEIVYLEVLLQRLFQLLPDDHKANLLKSYPPLQNVQIWKIFGLNSFPPDRVLLSNVIDKIVGLKLENITAPDWDLLVSACLATKQFHSNFHFSVICLIYFRVFQKTP